MRKTYRISGPGDAESLQALEAELQEEPWVHDFDLEKSGDSAAEFKLAITGVAFGDAQVSHVVESRGYEVLSDSDDAHD